ncbi:hypothetical protein RvY_16482 [Ramazzottius varieornatus]|uniref:TspO/MBR-related protein n=1 Tax=Ramazzottius varieornatus TaxID=947166 RepID=A0A1D1VYM5_RAMVA|nr:hypothetical protein RvY_16482 [Ramazzottius varieornatus]
MPIPSITASIFAREILPAILIPNLGGWATGLLTRTEIKSWYENLRKPSWRPPNSAFPIVWTSLYSAMGYASWLIYRSGSWANVKLPLTLYGTQLALNMLWSPLFFKAHRMKLALVDIGLLWVNVAACIFTFHPVNKTAAYLMVPYLGWLTLASALNYWIWKENPEEDASRKRL